LPKAKQNRAFPPKSIGRFNYWEYFRPGGLPTKQLFQRHIQQEFQLLLSASPIDLKEQFSPAFLKQLSASSNRQYFALKYYAEHDKEWEQNKKAQKVLKQLPRREQARIHQLSKKKWHYRSLRTWDALLQTIARDQERFENFCETPPESGILIGTDHRIYVTYSKQATKLLGGGSLIPKKRWKIYQDYEDRSSLLTPSGRLPSKSFFEFNWHDSSRQERQEAKKKTVHWFNHALRNLREYRYGRPPVPWTHRCERSCRRIQQKLCDL
jgi:hypothetical protein